MTDSSITHSRGGVLFSGPDAVELFRAAALGSAIGLLSRGIRPSSGWTMTKALAMCHRYTGRRYRRTEHEQALADLRVWIETMKSAIPTEVRS